MLTFGFALIALAAVAWFLASLFHRPKPTSIPQGKATVRCRAGVFESAVLGGSVWLPPNRKIEAGESLRVEIAESNGTRSYRVRALSAEGALDLDSLVDLGQEDRRSSPRVKLDSPCLLDDRPAQLIDVSELGARLSPSDLAVRGSRVLLRAAVFGDEPIGGWVLEDAPQCRIRFEEPVSLQSR